MRLIDEWTLALTAPTEKIMENRRRVNLLPIAEDTGAEPKAPKKAPACRTDTTLDETAFALLTSLVPSSLTKPKWERKNG